jgi:hypothetical protein
VLLCTSAAEAGDMKVVEMPPQLVFSLQHEGAKPEKKDGVFVYFEEPAPYDAVMRVIAYEYRGGSIQRKFGPGILEEDYLFLALNKIGFEAFDYEKEKQSVEAALTDTQRKGLARHLTDTGTEGTGSDVWMIEVRLSEKAMIFRDSMPRHRVAVYALYSERFKKLKEVLDLMAQIYGHSKLPI